VKTRETQDTKQTTRVVVDGVELTILQTVQIVQKHRRIYVNVKRVVARDRKRKLDITSGVETEMEDAIHLIRLLKQVAAFQTARCTCDYRYGYSDHAEHCQSIYVARYDGGVDDDD
jgi:hypothetical protein